MVVNLVYAVPSDSFAETRHVVKSLCHVQTTNNDIVINQISDKNNDDDDDDDDYDIPLLQLQVRLSKQSNPNKRAKQKELTKTMTMTTMTTTTMTMTTGTHYSKHVLNVAQAWASVLSLKVCIKLEYTQRMFVWEFITCLICL